MQIKLKYRWTIGVLALVLIFASACMRASEPAMYSEAGFDTAEMSADAPAATVEVEYASSRIVDYGALGEALSQASRSQAQQTQLIIYTGNISLVVKDTLESMEAITTLADELGGYVSNSNVYQSNAVPRGSITIRVPAERYDDALTALRAMALRVERENSGTEDVSEEFTDLQARQANLKVTEQALQQLLEERQRVGTTADILEVYRELTSIRGQIEQIEGRLRYLGNQAALSTISIELTPDVLYQPVQIAGWEPQGVARQALQALVAALQGLGTFLIWVIIFLIPLALLLLIPLYIAFRLLRWAWRRWRGRKVQQVVQVPEKETD